MWYPPKYRKSYKKKYGSRCFLQPKTLKYPICSRGKISCAGLNAAAYYARFNNKSLLKTIKRLKRRCYS